MENEQADAGRDLSRETKFSGAYGDRGIFIFPVQLSTSRTGNITRFINTLLYVITIHTNPVWPSSCVTPAGTSKKPDVQNKWEENTHTYMHTAESPPAQGRSPQGSSSNGCCLGRSPWTN